jgi:hypothetical protein
MSANPALDNVENSGDWQTWESDRRLEWRWEKNGESQILVRFRSHHDAALPPIDSLAYILLKRELIKRLPVSNLAVAEESGIYLCDQNGNKLPFELDSETLSRVLKEPHYWQMDIVLSYPPGMWV